MQVFPLFGARRRSVFLRIILLALPVVFLLTMLSQNVFAENTFVITDGDQVIVHTSRAADPALALDEAGVEIDGDAYITTQTEDGVYDITVQRMDTVTVINCGEAMEVKTEDATVGQILSQAGVTTGEGYVVSHPLETAVTDGMVITVDHLVTHEETYTLDIPFETKKVKDPSMPKGRKEIVTKGEVGQVLCTATVEYRNAQEVSRTVTQQTTLQEPKTQVVAVGTGKSVGKKNNEPIIGDGVIVLPTGEVLTYYKKDTYEATAYTMYDKGCNNTTATMTPVKWGVVAVDPKVIPYGTRMFIVNKDGSFVYGIGTAEDCGGAIKGKRLDLYMPTLTQAYDYGRQDVDVYFLGDANWTY